MNLSVVIPAYNEANKITKSIKKIKTYLSNKNIKHKIIVVNDGSIDNTLDVLKRIKGVKIINNKVNRGKGYSVKKGVLASTGSHILITDADLSTPIEDLSKFMDCLNYDIIIGSRKMPNSAIKEAQPIWRVAAGNFFPILVNILIIKDIKDTQCGFKLINKKAKKIFQKQTIDGFSFDVEILHIARKNKLKIKEIAVNWFNNPDTRLNFFKHSPVMFYELLRIKHNEIKGTYD